MAEVEGMIYSDLKELVAAFGSGVWLWYIVVQAFAFAGSMLASAWLHDLPDRGYAVGKALGLLLGAIIFWLIMTVGVLPNDTLAVIVALVSTWILAIWLHRHHSRPAVGWVLLVELAFALAFLCWTIVRAYKPEIWDGEKRMEIMMINAILRSERFPPHDPWMAGYNLSYYYLGYVMIAMLTKLSNLSPAITFNLAHATFFALAFVSAMGMGYALGARFVSHLDRRGLWTGTLAAVMLTLMGNLGGLLGVLRCADVLPDQFWTWLDVREIAKNTYACRALVPAQFGWWWDWSRVVKDYALNGKPQIVITETPIFSFIMADNHPHVVALPFVVAVLALSLAALRSGSVLQISSWGERMRFMLLAAILGSLSFLNAWDVPAYSAVFLVAVGYGAWKRKEPVLNIAAKLVALFLIAFLFFLPWRITFMSQAHGVAANLFNGTRLPQFFVMFAPLLMLWVGLVVYGQSRLHISLRERIASLGLGLALLLILVLAAMSIAFASGDTRTLLSEAFNADVANVEGMQLRQRLFERLVNPWTSALLAIGIASIALPVWRSLRVTSGLSDTELFALILFAVGGLLALGVEFFYVRDLFGRRLNSVFKFYYQAWTLWSIAGALALTVLLQARQWFKTVLGAVALVLVVAGMLWPALAVQARTNFFQQKPTLDGAQFLRQVMPADAAIIDWLNTHVSGTPTLIEAGSIESFKPEGRISAFTGLPTVVAWGRHQRQWRGEFDEIQRRAMLVEQLYTTTDWNEAKDILSEFGIKYVVVGNVEQDRFPDAGLEKFKYMCSLLHDGIYECD